MCEQHRAKLQAGKNCVWYALSWPHLRGIRRRHEGNNVPAVHHPAATITGIVTTSPVLQRGQRRTRTAPYSTTWQLDHSAPQRDGCQPQPLVCRRPTLIAHTWRTKCVHPWGPGRQRGGLNVTRWRGKKLEGIQASAATMVGLSMQQPAAQPKPHLPRGWPASLRSAAAQHSAWPALHPMSAWQWAKWERGGLRK